MFACSIYIRNYVCKYLPATSVQIFSHSNPSIKGLLGASELLFVAVLAQRFEFLQLTNVRQTAASTNRINTIAVICCSRRDGGRTPHFSQSPR